MPPKFDANLTPRLKQSALNRADRIAKAIENDDAAMARVIDARYIVPQAEVLRIAIDRGLATLEYFYFGEVPARRND